MAMTKSAPEPQQARRLTRSADSALLDVVSRALWCGHDLADLAAADESDDRAIGRAEQLTVEAYADALVAVEAAAFAAVPAFLRSELASRIDSDQSRI
jgi:hypothetical protein